LTLDDLYNPQEKVNFSGKSVRGLRWMKDGRHLLKAGEKGAYEVIDALSGETRPLFEASAMEAAFARLPGFDEEEARKAVERGRKTISSAEDSLLITFANDLFFYRIEDAAVIRLTDDAASESAASLSPSGEWTAFVKNYDLYVVENSSGREKRLTSDGCEDIRNGYLDWVYQDGKCPISPWWTTYPATSTWN